MKDNGLLEVRGILSDPPVGPPQVFAARPRRAPAAPLPFPPAVRRGCRCCPSRRRSGRRDRLGCHRRLTRDGAAEPDFEVVGMGPEHEEVERHLDTLSGRVAKFCVSFLRSGFEVYTLHVSIFRLFYATLYPERALSPVSSLKPNLRPRIRLAEMMAQQHAAGEIRAGHAVAGVAEREQMMRKVPVRADVGQAVGRQRYGTSQPYSGRMPEMSG